jgi:hypothetical protein
MFNENICTLNTTINISSNVNISPNVPAYIIAEGSYISEKIAHTTHTLHIQGRKRYIANNIKAII